jgi:hypothetical protein
MIERRTSGPAPSGALTTTVWPSAFVGLRI